MEAVLLIGLVLLAIGIFMRTGGQAGEVHLGVSVRDIVAADVGLEVPLKNTASARINSKTLFSKRYRVAGRMDYLEDGQAGLVPVEYKSARVLKPRGRDVFQLLTYCFLLTEEGHAVNHGRLKYANRNYEIPYGPREHQAVLQVLAEMRHAEGMPLKDIPPKRDQRCRGCVYSTICDRKRM